MNDEARQNPQQLVGARSQSRASAAHLVSARKKQIVKHNKETRPKEDFGPHNVAKHHLKGQ